MPEEPNTTVEPGSASVDPNSVEGLFVAALGKASGEERTAFLDEACGDDAEMRRRVEALLRAYDDAGSFLEKPAVDQPTTVADDADIRLDFLSPTDKPDRLGMLGHYEVMEVIGRGGMGIVLRALDPKLNRIVAIKALAPELAANPNARRRFTREAQAAASISHPHIVTIHAVEEEPWPFLVMECVEGQSLQEKLDKVGALRLTELLRIGRQIAEGLSAAHKQGLIHRDIKPANILLENGVERVKITDFGLARTVDDVAITKTGEVHGTPQFMSPEQARGERIDHRSDLFSLGCVLYAMCAGRPPFRAENLAGVMNRVINDQPRSLLELDPQTPSWLIDIVTMLLAKDPADRFQTADDVAAELEERLATAQGATPGSAQGGVAVRHRSRTRHPRSGQPVTGKHSLSAVLMLLAIAAFSFGTARLLEVPFQLILLGTIMLAVGLGGVMLAHWISRRPIRPRFGPAGLVFGLTAFVIGGMAGCPDGWNLFSGVQGEFISVAAFIAGAAALIGGWMTSPGQHRESAESSTRAEPAAAPRPVTALLWLGVGVLALMLLTPCALLFSWYFAGFAARPAPVRDARMPTDHPLSETHDTDYSHGNYESLQPVATGALILILPHGSLSVELRPLDLSSDPPAAQPGTVYSSGGNYEVAAGSYRPVVFDGAFGWLAQPEREPTAGYLSAFDVGSDMMEEMGGAAATPFNAVYVLPDIVVDEDTSTTLTVARDFAALAAAEPDWNRGGLYRFRWSTQEYLLDKPQAKMVQFLLQAYAAGQPELEAADLRDAFESDKDEALVDAINLDAGDDDNFDEFEWIFNEGRNPAWGTLIVRSEFGGGYRLVEAIEQTAHPFGMETSGFGPPTEESQAEIVQPVQIGPKLIVESMPEGSTGDRTAQVTVDIRDAGLFIAIRRKSSFTGENIGDEETVSVIGRTDLTLAGGTYEVLLRDPLFGWQQDRIESVEIDAGSMLTFVVQRDFREYSDPDDQHSGSWRQQIIWNGTRYGLTPGQAACVNLLLRRYGQGTHTASGEELVAVAQAWSPETSVDAIFSEIGTFNPSEPLETADALVVKVDGTAEYRLAPARLATIRPVFAHAWMAVTIVTSHGESFLLDGTADGGYGVPVGECRVTTIDYLTGWHSSDLNRVPYGKDVATHNLAGPGDTIIHNLSRNSGYFRRQADVEFPEDADAVVFTWFPPALLGGGGPMYEHVLDRQQAECVKVLLRALADGKPEMTAAEIESAAGLGDGSFPELFEGGVNIWGGLLIDGEEAETYRLVPPPEDMVSLGDAAGPSSPGSQPEPEGDQSDGAPGQLPPDPSVTTQGGAESVTANRPAVTGHTANDSLDRLVAIALQEYERLRQLHESGTVSTGELREAEIRVLDARVRRARALGDDGQLTELLGEIVALRKSRLAEREALSERGAASVADVSQARVELVEARIDLADATSRADELESLLADMVSLREEALQRIEQLVENGAAGEEELGQANAAVLEAQLRLATAQDDAETIHKLFEELISLREAELERARRLHERGYTSGLQVESAEALLLETRIRLEQSGDELQEPPGRLEEPDVESPER